VAHFDRVIPPGGEGKITLKVNTKGYQGKIIKTARVYSNDPANRSTTLTISAFIDVPIYLSSKYVYLCVVEGQKQARVVDIIAKQKRPLELTPEQYTLGGKVSYIIRELEKGKKFRIIFTNTNTSPGSYYGYLRLKTNYQEDPQITIRIRCRILKKRIPNKRPLSTPKAYLGAG